MYCQKTDTFSGEVFKENFTDIFYTNLEQIAFSIKNSVKKRTSLFLPKDKMSLHIKIGDYLSSGDKIGEKERNIPEPHYVNVASHLRSTYKCFEIQSKDKTQSFAQNCNCSPCPCPKTQVPKASLTNLLAKRSFALRRKALCFTGKAMPLKTELQPLKHKSPCKAKLCSPVLGLPAGLQISDLHKGNLCFTGSGYKCKAKLCKKICMRRKCKPCNCKKMINMHLRRTNLRFVPNAHALRARLYSVGTSILQSKALYAIDPGFALMQSEALRCYAIRARRSKASAVASFCPLGIKSSCPLKHNLCPCPKCISKAKQSEALRRSIFRSSSCKGNEKNIRTPLVLTSSGRVVMISKNQLVLQKTQPVLFYDSANLHVKKGEFVLQGAPLLTLTHQTLITGDIVQGIPRIEQLFEAFTSPQKGLKDKKRLNVHDTLHSQVRDIFRKNWLKNVLSVAVRKSLEEIGSILLEMIQKVYLSQGVLISDKHIEIIIRQMTSKGQILDSGSTGLLLEEVLPIRQIENANITTPGKKCLYVPSVVGLTAAALTCDSFISAASFQETTRVLSRDAVVGKTDFLRGLKEKVVIGDLISAGTGLDIYFVYTLFSESI